MHLSVLTWVSQQVATRDLAQRLTLEVGSLNVNGSVRQFFGSGYWGTDMQAGPGVDEVINAHDIGRWGPSYECIVCTEMLEHDDAPWATIEQMAQIAYSGCVLLVTARGFDHRGCFPVHEYPQDLWRFSVDGMRALLEWGGWTVEEVRLDPETPGVFAVASI